MHFRGADLGLESSKKKIPPHPTLNMQKAEEVDILMTLKQACSSEYQGAQGAFKNSMIHWILQFTLLIAFHCVLHRCKSQEIHCWKLYKFIGTKAHFLHSINIDGVYEKHKPENVRREKSILKTWMAGIQKDIQIYKRCTGGDIKMTSVHMLPREPAATYQVYFQ